MSSTPSAAPYERFVPQGRASLVEDAPGWGDKPVSSTAGSSSHHPLTTAKYTPSPESTDDGSSSSGPTCWRCRGRGVRKCKPAPKELPCSVCSGSGRLPPKRSEVMGATKPGKITRGRRCPVGWLPAGPLPKALSSTQKNGSATRWAKLAMEASTLKEDVEIQDRIADAVAVADDDDVPAPPIWIPEKGEELCNLVGSWRILQRVGSHRWTTDDLVTAYVAAEEMPSLMGNSLDNQETTLQLQYLDLGTGNASVLQMVTWFALANNRPLTAIGVEARLEAVQLARRSLSFNLGTAADKPVARIVHGDFRDVCPQFQQQEQQPFNLITGTPPYFRVDFSVQNQLVTSAVIRQGGMPTARQSAPARCEFRGGIEAYCEAASSVLKPETGRFVVCENWLNHDRVLAAAKQYNLHVLRQVEVQGREGRATLFCVYVMKSKSNDEPATRRENLAVRDGHGNWTERYSRTVLGTMSIPNVDVAPEKSG